MDAVRRLRELEGEIEREARTSRPSGEVAVAPAVTARPAPWVRLAATWLDLGVGITMAAAATVAIALGTEPSALVRWADSSPVVADAALSTLAAAARLGLLVAVPLWLLPESLLGGSAGKRLLGLAITTPAGAPAARPLLLGRALLKGLGPLLVALGWLSGWSWLVSAGTGVLTVLAAGALLAIGPARRALHDRMSGTAVGMSHMRIPLSLPSREAT